MSLESDFFKKKRVQFNRLIPFGFVKTGEDYTYQETFMDGDFKAIITISNGGEVSGRVIDLALGEDYLALRVERQLGTYVGQVRASYMELLGRIADACFEALPFAKDQTNRMVKHFEEAYDDQLNYPFAKFPQYASFRVAGKWYALIFPIKMAKLGDFLGEIAERDVEVVNIKVDPKKLDDLLERDGIYPSYHMSKKSWVSVVLDDSLSDAELFDLVAASRQLVAPKNKVSTGPDFWIIPANPKFYDIDTEFATHKIIDWTQKGKIAVGDYVFIYITAPVRALRYACQVVERDVDKSDYLDKPDVDKFMRLKLFKRFADDDYPIDFLAEHGVKTVRGPRRMTEDLIEKVKKELKDDSTCSIKRCPSSSYPKSARTGL